MPVDDIPKVEGREDFLLDCTVLLEEKAGTNLPALIGYLDARRLGSRIRGTWRRCGVVDNVSCIQGPAQPLVIIHHPHISTAPLSRGWGFRGMYRPTCFAASTLSLWVLSGQRRAWALCIYKKYTWSIGNYAIWCTITGPSSCRSLNFKL